MHIDRPFSTPIFYTQLEDENLFGIQEEIGKSLQGYEWTFNENWQSHWIAGDFDSDIISELNLDKFAKHLDTQIRVVCDEINFPYVEYKRQSWFTKLNQNNYAHKHNHGMSDISGVYYFKTNGEEDGNIKFHTPAIQSYSSIFKEHCSKPFYYEPHVGKMLMFPGFLEHSVGTNINDNERISMSFNIIFNKYII
tara:strand:- start:64 stop:645 length:582 start_codon:yes stop_codon:yes gene_type:complete